MSLPTNFKDDVFASGTTRRKYNMITNNDGTVSFEDVTEYTQNGDNFGAAQINATNKAVNDISDNIIDDSTTLLNNTKEGKVAGALSVKSLYEDIATNDKMYVCARARTTFDGAGAAIEATQGFENATFYTKKLSDDIKTSFYNELAYITNNRNYPIYLRLVHSQLRIKNGSSNDVIFSSGLVNDVETSSYFSFFTESTSVSGNTDSAMNTDVERIVLLKSKEQMILKDQASLVFSSKTNSSSFIYESGLIIQEL